MWMLVQCCLNKWSGLLVPRVIIRCPHYFFCSCHSEWATESKGKPNRLLVSTIDHGRSRGWVTCGDKTAIIIFYSQSVTVLFLWNSTLILINPSWIHWQRRIPSWGVTAFSRCIFTRVRNDMEDYGTFGILVNPFYETRYLSVCHCFPTFPFLFASISYTLTLWPY